MTPEEKQKKSRLTIVAIVLACCGYYCAIPYICCVAWGACGLACKIISHNRTILILCMLFVMLSVRLQALLKVCAFIYRYGEQEANIRTV